VSVDRRIGVFEPLRELLRHDPVVAPVDRCDESRLRIETLDYMKFELYLKLE
jgi:hypothetical protein